MRTAMPPDDPSPSQDRRGFLTHAGLATLSGLLGAAIPFHRFLPEGFVPVALAQEPLLAGKDGLTVLNDRPLNAETPAHLLDDSVTPTARHFIRNNGTPPFEVDETAWTLTLDGEVETALTLSIDDLKRDFETVTYALVIECGGNGRAFFNRPARGNQWTYGAVGCSEWTGVRLADLLRAAGVKDSAVYTAHYGADTHLSGNPDLDPISRGVPIAKALDPYNLVAFAMNGAPIHPMHGAPLRLVIPGWPGSVSHKWLTRIQLRDRVHDGAKMGGTSYRVPKQPVAPGGRMTEASSRIIEAMPVKSLITFPQSGMETDKPALSVRGHGWAGDRSIARVETSIDFGASWQAATVDAPVNPHAWQNWRAEIVLPQPGYYEIWARATDSEGVMQPHAIPWNPKGYLNNAMHRIAVTYRA